MMSGAPDGGLPPRVRLLQRLLSAGPPTSIARMDAAALARAQATTIPERGPIELLLGLTRRDVRIERREFLASHGARLPVRVCSPLTPGGDRPLVVVFHGGGFALGAARQSDWSVSRVARELDAVVVSVDYRLAPGHPFPAAFEDCWDTLVWAAGNATELGADPGRIGLMGDSAGGSLAACVALAARDRGGPPVAHQALVYPVTDMTDGLYESASFRANAGVVPLTADDMRTFHRYYLGDQDPADPQVSPLCAKDLSGLPPAVVVVAGHDLLHDTGVAYADALRAAGVPVTLDNHPRMPHGFLTFPYFCRDARPALATVIASQRAALRPTRLSR